MKNNLLIKSSLVLLTSLSLCSCGPTGIKDVVYENMKEVEVSFPCSFGPSRGSTLKTKAYYSDDYFTYNNLSYVPQIGTLSLSLALASFNSSADKSSYSSMADNLESFMNQIGMTNYEVNNDFITKPTEDSLGVGIGSKKINNYTLIALGTRGSEYEKEWSSNFKISGPNQDEYHQGFYDGSEIILNFLNDYINKHSITGKIKIWISGYSRSAACSNIFSGRILKDPSLVSSNVSFEKEDLYSYTFETPRGVIKSSSLNPQDFLYSNIYSIISQNDPITKVTMNSFGYERFGVDYYTPYTLNDTVSPSYPSYRSKMLEFYSELDPNGLTYTVDDLSSYNIDFTNENIIISDDKHINYTPGIIFNTILPYLSKNVIKNKDNYIDDVEESLRYTISTLISDFTPSELILLGNNLTSIIKANGINIVSFLKNDVNEIYDTLLPIIKSATENAKLSLNPEHITKTMANLIYAGLATASLYPFEVATLANGISAIEPHLPEFALSWMKGQDPNYYEDGYALYDLSQYGGYSILNINRIGNLKVYNMHNDLIAEVKDGKPVKLENSSIPVGVDDGQINIYLPSGVNYFINFEGTRNTTVKYILSNYIDDDEITIQSSGEFTITRGETKKFNC